MAKEIDNKELYSILKGKGPTVEEEHGPRRRGMQETGDNSPDEAQQAFFEQCVEIATHTLVVAVDMEQEHGLGHRHFSIPDEDVEIAARRRQEEQKDKSFDKYLANSMER